MLELFNFFLYKISTPAESQQQLTSNNTTYYKRFVKIIF